MLAWDAWHAALGANPIEYFLRTTGVMTLVFVMVTLSVTPLRKIFGWNQLIRYRRILGLFAFFYGLIHLTTFLGHADPASELPAAWRVPTIPPVRGFVMRA